MARKNDSDVVRRKPGHVELTIWNVPVAVRNDFKAACARKGIPMREAVIDLLQRFAKGSRPLQQEKS